MEMYTKFGDLKAEQIIYLEKLKITNEQEYEQFINWIDSIMTSFISWEAMDKFQQKLNKLVENGKQEQN